MIINGIETLISIFTIKEGVIKVLLFKKDNDPYRGYWMLPRAILENNETVEASIDNYIINNLGFNDLYKEQCFVFSEPNRLLDKRVIAVTFIGLIDSKSIELKQLDDKQMQFEWFSISLIPKMAYDHKEIIIKSIECLKEKVKDLRTLKILFPSDFTLIELQNLYEQLYNKKIDRRNFRKRFINLIQETGDKTKGVTGRPAKLYYFQRDENNSVNNFN